MDIFWQNIDKEFQLVSVYIDHLIWQMGNNGVKNKRYSFEEFKKLEYNDSTNIFGMANKKYPFYQYWAEQIMRIKL